MLYNKLDSVEDAKKWFCSKDAKLSFFNQMIEINETLSLFEKTSCSVYHVCCDIQRLFEILSIEGISTVFNFELRSEMANMIGIVNNPDCEVATNKEITTLQRKIKGLDETQVEGPFKDIAQVAEYVFNSLNTLGGYTVDFKNNKINRNDFKCLLSRVLFNMYLEFAYWGVDLYNTPTKKDGINLISDAVDDFVTLVESRGDDACFGSRYIKAKAEKYSKDILSVVLV